MIEDRTPPPDARDDVDDRWYKDFVSSARPVSVLTTVAITVGLALLGANMPQIEGKFLPVFDRNDIPAKFVSRVGQKLCWTREGRKSRNLPLSDVDVIVDYISNVTHKLAHQPTPSLYDKESGEEITTDDIVPGGKDFVVERCLNLSNRILPGQPFRVRQIAYYQSWTGLYDVPVTFPTIILPAESGYLFSQRHDTAPSPGALPPDAVAGPPPAGFKPDKRSSNDDLRAILRDVASAAGDEDVAQPAPSRPSVSVATTVTEDEADAIEQSRAAHGDRSRAAVLRRWVRRSLKLERDEDLGDYDPSRK